MSSTLALVGRRRAVHLVVAFGSMVAMLTATTAPIDAGSPIATFDVVIGDCVLAGHTDPHLQVRIEDRTVHGALKAKTTVTADGAGAWQSPCLPHLGIKAHDHLKAYDQATQQEIGTFNVPRLDVAVDRVADRAKGHGPSDTDVTLQLTQCFPAYVTCDYFDDQTFHTNSIGVFDAALQHSWTAIGGQPLSLSWTSPGGNRAWAYATVPYMQATIGSAIVSGSGSPGAKHTLTLRSAHGSVRAHATATGSTYDGSWSTTLRNNGSPVKVKIGDTLHGSFASDAALKVRAIGAQVDLVTNTLSGTCLPNQLVGVKLKAKTGFAKAEARGTAGPNGELDALNAFFLEKVRHGWSLDLYCNDSRGDVIHRHQVVP